jgi:Tol biopolymer transport system component
MPSVMRRRLALAVLLLAAAVAPSARAVPLGATVLIDRPDGFGALPFDGIASSSAREHSLTPDGRFVVFSSASNALLAGDEDTATNVYRLDLTTGTLVQVDTTATGAQPTPGSENEDASISADGNHVGFFTSSAALDPAASGESRQFVVKNLTTGALELASRANGPSGAPVADLQFAVLSGDGRHVAFTAASAVQADNATGLTTTTDAYERSLDANTTHMMSVTSPGNAEGGGVRDAPDIDFAGDAVAFASSSALVAGDTDTREDAYVRSLIVPERTLLVSFSGSGQTAGADSASDVAIAGGASGEMDVAWTDDREVWFAPCSLVCNTVASQVDHAHTGGQDNGGNESPFFPPEANSSLPTRVYWDSRDPLDPADTNNAFDMYGWKIGDNSFDTSIQLMTSGKDSGGAFGETATDDSALAVFDSASPNLPGSDGLVEQAFIRKAGVDTNISQPLGQPPRMSQAGFGFISPLHATSDDGGVVAFSSDAPAFGSQILLNGPPTQVLVRDVAAGTTRLLSAAPDGVTAGDGSSRSPSVDAAGDRVVFESAASNLVPGDTNQRSDVFVRDLRDGVTTLVDRTAGGGFPVNGANSPQISADGTKVVYASNSVDIPGAPPGSDQHIYETDLATGNVTLVDRSSTGAAADSSSSQPDIDGDGGRVAFTSSALNLGGGTEDSIYVRDLANSTTSWASVPQDGSPAHDSAQSPSIDRDGTRVVFAERNALFGFGMVGFGQVFVRDLPAQTTTLASTGPSGPASPSAFRPSLSADGSRLSFVSSAGNLPGATPGFSEVYVRDLRAATTALGATVDGGASGGRFGADSGSLSGNGECVAFQSTSDGLVAGGYGSDFEHVFLHALGGACPAVAIPSSPPPPAPTPSPDKTPPVIGRFAMTHKRFAVGAKPTALSAARRKVKVTVRGTSFDFTLSEAATIRIAISQTVKGHRGSAKRPCGVARRGQKHNCSRTATLLTLVRAHGGLGSNTVAFSGRYGRSRLAKGSYIATITATDVAGNHSSPHSLAFAVVG